MLTIWNTFKALYPRATYVEGLPTGTSQPLTAACVEMFTAYTNNIAENFESRVLRYHLQSKIILSHHMYSSVTESNMFVICRT